METQDFGDLINLPAPLRGVQLRPLFAMQLAVRKLQVVGPTPAALRRVGAIFGGVFKGDRLEGTVMDGGSDWQAVRSDGATSLDVRLVLQTSDGSAIMMTYRGIRHGPADAIERLERGEVVDPAALYFRIAPIFETASPRHDWMNRILAIGVGHRLPEGPLYSVFEVL